MEVIKIHVNVVAARTTIAVAVSLDNTTQCSILIPKCCQASKIAEEKLSLLENLVVSTRLCYKIDHPLT